MFCIALPHFCCEASVSLAPNAGIPQFQHLFVLVEENAIIILRELGARPRPEHER